MAMKSDSFEHADWEEKSLRILGTTYPNHSMKYVEVACTGAIDEATGAMIRIHPMPRRYLADDKRFQNFQRIRARVRPNFSDGRPESMRIDPDSIVPLDVIPAKNHAARRRFVEESPNLVRSVEELLTRQKLEGMSLGAIRPKEILRTYLKTRSPKDIAAWKRKQQELTSQQFIAGEPRPMKLDCPEVTFQVRWRCDDPRCHTPHDMGLKTWGLHELYRRYTDERDPERDEKVKASLERMFDLSKRDVFLFLGTFVDLRFEFGLMDALSVPRIDQLSLL
jgi:hypothetical protein